MASVATPRLIGGRRGISYRRFFRLGRRFDFFLGFRGVLRSGERARYADVGHEG